MRHYLTRMKEMCILTFWGTTSDSLAAFSSNIDGVGQTYLATGFGLIFSILFLTHNRLIYNFGYQLAIGSFLLCQLIRQLFVMKAFFILMAIIRQHWTVYWLFYCNKWLLWFRKFFVVLWLDYQFEEYSFHLILEKLLLIRLDTERLCSKVCLFPDFSRKLMSMIFRHSIEYIQVC